MFDAMLTEGIIEKRSSYYRFKDEQVAGKTAAFEMVVRRKDELVAALEAKHGSK